MSVSRGISLGLNGMLLKDGVDILKFDPENGELIIELPEKSFAYNTEKIKSGEDYVKRLKEILIELGILLKDSKIKYRTKPIEWTKEMGDMNYEENKKFLCGCK